jgi:mannonate dehydratase
MNMAVQSPAATLNGEHPAVAPTCDGRLEGSMDRRTFLAAGTAALAAPVASLAGDQQRGEAVGPKPSRKFLATLGMQDYATDDFLQMYSAFGIEHICGSLPSRRLDEKWSVEGLVKERERIERFGIHLDILPLPLSSVEIAKAEYPSIMLGKTPDRDRDIDDICQMIRNASKAGIPALKYNMSILGIVRTEPVKGRGSSIAKSFVYGEAKQEPPLTEAGRVTEDMSWERITHFVKRVIPVAEEYQVRLMVHPHDPGMPRGEGFQGVERVLGSVDGLKRFVDIVQSPYHGLNFCIGTVAEMLTNPATEIFDVVRYFGTRRKIFNVHFRNIKGGFLNFREAYPDEGDMNMLNVMRVLKEVGYDRIIMPDHVPSIPGDPGNYMGGKVAFAFALGYVRALMQTVEAEG